MKSVIDLGVIMKDQSSSSNDIIRVLRQLNSSITVSNRAVISELNLKDNDLAVLNALDQKGPLSPGELAQITHTHLATMTGILTRLEKNGWVVRENSQTDRRSTTIRTIGSDRLSRRFEKINQRILTTYDTFNHQEQSAIIQFIQEVAQMIEHDSNEDGE